MRKSRVDNVWPNDDGNEAGEPFSLPVSPSVSQKDEELKHAFSRWATLGVVSVPTAAVVGTGYVLVAKFLGWLWGVL